MEDKEVLKAFKLAIDAILDRLEEMDGMYHATDERIHKLEECLFDEILEPVNSLFSERERKDRRTKFGEKYKDSLDPFCEDYKKLYGDELDLYDDCFNEWDNLESDEDKEEYIKKVIETIGKDRDRMKEKFGKPVAEVVSVDVETDTDELDNENKEWEDAAKLLKKYR